jgi:hypothetical protein
MIGSSSVVYNVMRIVEMEIGIHEREDATVVLFIPVYDLVE